ncbi:hypothetical protein POKO110462_06870 [Pontibacter korlensis]|uniref:STAS/SEC14 domain-containing protein n=1 Tax=Pontibacter korlensis TaxID=400092 RepID=A0A0E3ZFU2_9BACT|nr:hypothetical protein [Pontibacter korlensis]AKD04495.1 hypothetical protein PKOR_17110 [Pontibacter korlensis]
MNTSTIIDLGFYKIEVEESSNLVKADWTRSVNKDEMVAGGTKLYEVLRDTKLENAIADARKLTALSSETKEWMASKFYELLSQTNVKKVARVVPNDVFSRIALESVVTRAEALGVTKFEVKSFTSPTIALAWLNS